MFFVLSKVLQYLVQPIVIVTLLLGLGLIIRKTPWNRFFLIAGFSLLLIFSNQFLANEVMTWWELPSKPYSAIRNYDAAVMLTGIAVAKSNGPDDRVYLYLGADRLNHTVELYKLGKVKKIIVSGGIGYLDREVVPEAIRLKRLMTLMGVPDSVVFVDHSSDNTYENALESKRLLDSLQIIPGNCLLVTSAFHMRRATACFQKANANMDYFTCDFRSQPRTFEWHVLLVPKLDAILIWQKLLKEWVGMLAYKFAGYI